MVRRCPPGMVCFPDSFNIISWPSVTLVLILLVTVGLVTWSLRNQEKITTDIFAQLLAKHQQPSTTVTMKSGDDRYSRAPEAERLWDTGPDLSRIPSASAPFNIPTQGLPESYQSMGIVKTSDGKLLPLYGRRSISSRDRYNYYTRTDTYNPVQIPIKIKGRDCQDGVGCPELYDGDNVKLSATGETGEVTIYRVRDIVR
jgi:hypothetical protein